MQQVCKGIILDKKEVLFGLEDSAMSIFTHTTSSCSVGLQNRDLLPITLTIGKKRKPSEKEFLQWSTSYPDTNLPGELHTVEYWFQKYPDRRKTRRGIGI